MQNEENAGNWNDRDSDGTSTTDTEVETKRKQRHLEQSVQGQRTKATVKSWRAPDPLSNLSFARKSISQITRTRVEQFIGFADEEKLALVVDDEVDAAIVQYLNTSYSQCRPVSNGEVLLRGASLLSTLLRKVGWTKTRSIVESPEGLEKESSDKVKATTAKNDLV